MKKTVAASTFKNYMTCSRRVLEAFAEFAPQQIRPTHIAQFLDDNKDTPSIASLLRAFLRGAVERAEHRLVGHSPPAPRSAGAQQGRVEPGSDAEQRDARGGEAECGWGDGLGHGQASGGGYSMWSSGSS